MAKEVPLDKAVKILQKSIVQNPGINLDPGETCYFASEANAAIGHTMTVGSSYTGRGSSIGARYNVFGVNIRSGSRSYSGYRENVRGTVIDQYGGHFYLTDKRMILIAYKGGFDVPLNKVLALEFDNGGFMLVSGGKSYLCILPDVKKLKQVIEASSVYTRAKLAGKSQQTAQPMTETSAVEQSAPSNTVPDLMSYKPSGDSSKAKIVLWVVFGICGFLAIFALTRPNLRLFMAFAPIAAGAILHIDPANLRSKGKMLPIWATWIICVGILALGVGLVR